MTTTRRAHTRRTPSGRTTRVRRHKVNHAHTASHLLDLSGIRTWLNLSRGINRVQDGLDLAAGRGSTKTQRAIGALLTTAGMVEIGAVGITRASWAFGLLGLAAVFAGIALWRGDLPRKPKPRKPPAGRPDRGRRRTDEVI